MNKADLYIKKLNLNSHPEGGYFREMYRSDETIEQGELPDRYSGWRSFSTSIYFLLKGEQKSLLHKLKSDEVWHFYDGSSVRLFMLSGKGKLSAAILGRDIEKGELLQCVIQKEQWFCAEVIDKNSFTLVGCTVSPGFDFTDFELANREQLLKLFSEHKEIINRFTL